ncbi:MAG TPA: hypothetical protein VLB46_09430 [Pyrinomonadaceae bacterium]|nr:hypothetical protein [Pyrinomonadaceae bacterium]
MNQKHLSLFLLVVALCCVALLRIDYLNPVTAQTQQAAQADSKTNDQNQSGNDTRKVPKSDDKKNDDNKSENKKSENKKSDDNKGSGQQQKNCHTESYICGYRTQRYICGHHKECPDGNDKPCWDVPEWCERQVPEYCTKEVCN